MSARRVESIDQFRGLTIILMVTVNYLSGVHIVPAWLKHAPGVGLTFVDIIAPAFLFAIGLTYRTSFERRLERDGRAATIRHFLTRWFALVGIGAILSVGDGLTGATGHVSDWGVLQAIGVAGLLTLPVIRRPVWFRLGVAAVLLVSYQLGHDLLLADYVERSSHGGLWGALSWSAVLMLSTCLVDIARRHRAKTGAQIPPKSVVVGVLASLGMGAAGMLLAVIVPISKSEVSASYVLITVGISGLVYELFRISADIARIRVLPLDWWGRNPLLLYVLHEVLLGLVVLPGVGWWYADAAPWLVGAQATALLAALTGVSLWLYRKQIVVSL